MPWSGPTSGLIHRWPLDAANSSGGVDSDVVGSINITEHGGISSTAGPSGAPNTARLFDGVIGTQGTFGSSPLPTTGAFTVSAWAYTTDNNTQTGGSVPTVFDLASNGSTLNCVRLCTDGSGTVNPPDQIGDVYVVLYPGDINLSSLPVPFATAGWTQVGVTFNGTSTYQIVINGLVVGQQTGSAGRATTFDDSIGARDSTAGCWNGGIAQLAVYNRVLSSAELMQLYNADASALVLMPQIVT